MSSVVDEKLDELVDQVLLLKNTMAWRTLRHTILIDSIINNIGEVKRMLDVAVTLADMSIVDE